MHFELVPRIYLRVLRLDSPKDKKLMPKDLKHIANTDPAYYENVKNVLEKLSGVKYKSDKYLKRAIMQIQRQQQRWRPLDLEVEGYTIFTVKFPKLGKIPLADIRMVSD